MFQPSTDSETFWAQALDIKWAYACVECEPGEECQVCGGSGRVIEAPEEAPEDAPVDECEGAEEDGSLDEREDTDSTSHNDWVQLLFECPACSGEEACPICAGDRFVPPYAFRAWVLGNFRHIEICPECEGDPVRAEMACFCNGVTLVPGDDAREYYRRFRSRADLIELGEGYRPQSWPRCESGS